MLVAVLSPALEDPLVPPLVFTIVGVAWVVLARSGPTPAVGHAAALAEAGPALDQAEPAGDEAATVGDAPASVGPPADPEAGPQSGPQRTESDQ
jgi:hypothetical protein